MTNLRNVPHSLVVHSVERACHMHSDYFTENRMKYIKITRENPDRNREKDAYFEPDGQKEDVRM